MRFDPTGSRVLLVGDSLSLGGGPYDLLAREAGARGAEVRTNAVVGRSVLSAPHLIGGRYDVTLVALGTNDWGHPSGLLERAAEGLLRRLGDITADRVIWLGPPAVVPGDVDLQLQRVDRCLFSVVGRRDYVSTRIVTDGMSRDGRTPDGVHFNRRGAEWTSAALVDLLLPPKGEDPMPRMRALPRPSPAATLALGLMALVLNRRVKLDLERKMGADV